MTNHGMLVCSFSFRGRFKKGDDVIYSLNHSHIIEQEGSPLVMENAVEMFQLFCEAHVEFKDDTKKKKVFSIKENSFDQYETDTYSAVSFVVKSGSYGIEADITNKNTYQVTYHKSEDESDVKEFLCVVYIPKDVGGLQIKKGIFVFQSIGSYGVKTITTDMMRTFFADMNLTLETRSVSVSAFLEKLIDQGSLHKLTLIRNRLSPNYADNMLITTGREEQVFVKPRPQDTWLRRIFAIFRKADETGIVEIPEDEDFDDMAIQFKLGNKFRTVRLGNLERVSIIEDIPDAIVKKRSAPQIVRHMIETADAYKERMVWGEPIEV